MDTDAVMATSVGVSRSLNEPAEMEAGERVALTGDSDSIPDDDTGNLPSMSYQQVGAHHDPKSAFVVYRGFVYDVTDFLQFHPGGRSILIPSLGTDITDTVDTFHAKYVGRLIESGEHRNQYGIRLVGKLREAPRNDHNRIGLYHYQSRREYQRPDRMGDELRKQVYAYLRELKLPLRKSIVNSLLLLWFFYCLYSTAIYFAFIQRSVIWCILLGPIATFTAVNVAHTVMHGGFADSKVVTFLGRTLWDLGGYSSYSWDIEHQSHHQAPHTSVDVQTAGRSVVRFFEHQEFRPFHRYQMIYIWLAFVLYAPSSWVIHSYNTLFKYKGISLSGKLLHIAAKAVGFILPISLSFYLGDVGIASRNLMVFAASVSYFSLFSAFIQHEDSYLAESSEEPWSYRQVTTSSTWYTKNFVLEWLLGYFNYHTEHHLFPGLNPALYPKIQPIVRSTCAKFGVPYKHISFFQLVRSQIVAWRKFSKEYHPRCESLAPFV